MACLAILFLLSNVLFANGFQPNLLKYKEEYFLTNNKNANFDLINLSEYEYQRSFDPESQIILRLYTRENLLTENVIIKGNTTSLNNSNYDKNKPTKIIIHGYTDDGDSPMMKMVKDAFLDSLDINMITVDWNAGANGIYTTAVRNVPLAGRFVGGFIDWLVSEGSFVSNFHVMGHSLGAHVAGIACRSVTKGKIPYLTALDPALPLWDANSQRVNKTDAAYVEVIHTNSGIFGISIPIGHNDFYPNGGALQPGCTVIDIACSHNRAYDYFAYSLDNTKFLAMQCADHNEALNGECSNIGTLHMGGSKPKKEMGVFYLVTGATPPYYE